VTHSRSNGLGDDEVSSALPVTASRTSALLTPRKVAQCGKRVQRFRRPSPDAYVITESLPFVFGGTEKVRKSRVQFDQQRERGGLFGGVVTSLVVCRAACLTCGCATATGRVPLAQLPAVASLLRLRLSAPASDEGSVERERATVPCAQIAIVQIIAPDACNRPQGVARKMREPPLDSRNPEQTRDVDVGGYGAR
jgi:hypothetical protein